MPKIADFIEIDLEDLEIAQGQVRTRDVSKGIAELADSIRQVGLLHPIVVCPSGRKGKYEILLGQRRYLAYRELQRRSIMCAVFDEKIDPTTAKIISLTENIVRLGLNRNDLIDACTALYKKYGSIRAVIEESGLPRPDIEQYVKYDRLMPELKRLVDEEGLDIKVALRAQKAAELRAPGCDPDPEEAVKYAKEMKQMSGANQLRMIEEVRENPGKSPDEIVESSKTGEKLVQVMVTISQTVHNGLKRYATEDRSTMDEAAATLISDGLLIRGFLGE